MRAGTVVGVIGFMGAGKGLTLQLYAALYRRAGLGVYTNYDSRLAHVRLENIPQLVECERGCVFWDEIDLNLHAREFGSDLSIKVVKWIKMIRKQTLRLIWASQNPYFVDISIRRVTHYLINCVLVKGSPLSTRLDVYKVEAGGEMFIYKHSLQFQHNDWLYTSYNTFDKRNILSPELGGVARPPLTAEDFMHRQEQSNKAAKVWQTWRLEKMEKDLEELRSRLSSQQLAAPSSEAGAASNGRRRLSDLR